jgi:hypothetical protein
VNTRRIGPTAASGLIGACSGALWGALGPLLTDASLPTAMVQGALVVGALSMLVALVFELGHRLCGGMAD